MTIPRPTIAKALNHRRFFLDCLHRHDAPQASNPGATPRTTRIRATGYSSWTLPAALAINLNLLLEHQHLGISQPRLLQLIAYTAPLYIVAVLFFIAFASLYKSLGISRISAWGWIPLLLGISVGSFFFSRFGAGVGVNKALSSILEFAMGRITKNRTITTLTGVFYCNIGSDDCGGCRNCGEEEREE